MYKVKKEYSGKVRLEDGNGSVVLDENTPQEVLSKLHHSSVLGKGFIELVATAPVEKPVVAAQTKNDGTAK